MLSTQEISKPGHSEHTNEYAEPLKFLLMIMIFSVIMLILTVLMMWGIGAVLGDNFNTIFQLEGESPFY